MPVPEHLLWVVTNHQPESTVGTFKSGGKLFTKEIGWMKKVTQLRSLYVRLDLSGNIWVGVPWRKFLFQKLLLTLF